MQEIRFSRKPYDVTYRDFHTGELVTEKRRPPEKLHNMLPEDVVELSTKKNADWPAGEDVTVTDINYKQPNVLKVAKSDGSTTFVDYYDAELKEEVGYRENNQVRAKSSKYLTWP